VLRGSDWSIASITTVHGHLTLPALASWLGLPRAIALWLALSFVVAAGVGWRLIIDSRGFLFSWTWYRVPLSWRRLPAGSPFAVDVDLWARGDFAEWVRVGPDGDARSCEFGSAVAAGDVVAAMHRAVARHALPPPAAPPYRSYRERE